MHTRRLTLKLGGGQRPGLRHVTGQTDWVALPVGVRRGRRTLPSALRARAVGTGGRTGNSVLDEMSVPDRRQPSRVGVRRLCECAGHCSCCSELPGAHGSIATDQVQHAIASRLATSSRAPRPQTPARR